MSTDLLIDLAVTSPVLVLSLGALAALLRESFLSKAQGGERASVAILVVVIAFVCNLVFVPVLVQGGTAFGALVYADTLTFFLNLLILGGTLLALAVGVRRIGDEGIESPGEYYVLTLCTTAGALVFVSAADLITLFLGLEIMSLALYCLCGCALRSRRSAEAALKYFLLGSFSSAFLLFGMALLYGVTGSLLIPEIAQKISGADPAIAGVAAAMLVIGTAFKLGVVPFHFWVPDVYQGAPTTVTAYMACVVKAAAVGATLRLLWGALGTVPHLWMGGLWYVAFITMTVGNLVAIRQRSVKRMLAYSSIAHAGYMTVALLVPAADFGGGPAILYYLVAYTFMTMGAFAVVIAVTSKHENEVYPDDLTRFNGLGRSQPLLGVVMALFMLSLAGIPPGMAGLLGKFYIFNAAVKGHLIGLTIVGVLNSAISAYYYLRVIVAMYFLEPEGEDAPHPQVELGVFAVLTVCAIGVVYLGIFPSSVYDLAQVAAETFRTGGGQ